MAKGQLRGNKEAKKPKKEKVKAAAPESTLTTRITASQERTKNARK